MSRKIALIVSLFLFVVGCDKIGSQGPAVRALADDDVPATAVCHYYMSADSAIMELWVCADSALDVDTAVWHEVTLDSLHDAGLESPSENLVAALGSGFVSQGPEVDGNRYRSYLNCTSNPKRVVAGSETWRSVMTPGWLRTYGASFCNNGCYFSRITAYQWGWKSYIQAPPKSYTQVYPWKQNGSHWFWHDSRDPVTSQVETWF